MRIILILVMLGGLILLLAYNLTPVPLTFLGMTTPALPLAVWILLSVAAGAITSLLLTGLQGLSNQFARSSRSKRRNDEVEVPPPRSNEQQRAAYTGYTAPEPSKQKTESTSSTESTKRDDFDDWESDSTKDDDWNTDDWGAEEDTNKQDTDKTQERKNSSPQTEIRDFRNYEVNNEPKSSNRSGSVYSYGYREPKNTGVGKTESVYDADYRVVTPPYRQIDTAPEDNDWGFEDDEFFDDEADKDSPTRK